MVLLFVTACYGYYRLCLAVGHAMAWGFLTGFLPAALAAVVATRAGRSWVPIVADIVGFSAYF
jgi:hypothetical protein